MARDIICIRTSILEKFELKRRQAGSDMEAIPETIPMDLVPDNETGGFCFTWTIQNFSFCLQKEGIFDSPMFTLDRSYSTKWKIGLYPRGNSKPDTLACVLFKVNDGINIPTEVSYVFSIRTNSGLYKKESSITHRFRNGEEYGRQWCLTHEELLKQGDDGFLENDTLTIRCRVRLNGLNTVQCHARTIIHVERTSVVWTLENFKDIQNEIKTTELPNSVEFRSFTIRLFFTEGSVAEKKIQIEVDQMSTLKPNFFTCDIALLTSEGKFVQLIKDDHSFKISKVQQIWKLPHILKSKLMAKRELYLPNDTLSLRCKFAISAGVKYSEIESTEYGIVEDTRIGCRDQIVDSGSLRHDLQHFFKEQKFSDLTLRTPSKKFNVHKAILCARSAVFSAMFDNDMKENQTSDVEIEDLEDDIVSKMLLFVYTDVIEKDLKWENASKLYFAADKYEISALKRKCSDFLKDHLNTVNVCDVLVLADMHQDDVMKSAAQDFIVDRGTEFMITEEWKNFMKNRAHLASETMHLLIVRKLEI